MVRDANLRPPWYRQLTAVGGALVHDDVLMYQVIDELPGWWQSRCRPQR